MLWMERIVAVIWKKGKIKDLGTVDSDACSRAYGLNERGQVVGGSGDCQAFLHAFVWEKGGPIRDLNKLIPPDSGWVLTNAFNINDRGEILAKAVAKAEGKSLVGVVQTRPPQPNITIALRDDLGVSPSGGTGLPHGVPTTGLPPPRSGQSTGCMPA